MRIRILRVSLFLVGIGLFLCAGLYGPRLETIAFTHHSFNAQFDASKSTRWVGIVTKVEWINPHARFYVDVKDLNGNVTNWNFALGSPIQLHRQRRPWDSLWAWDSLKVGDQVTVDGYPAKDGAKMASPKKILLPDGWTVFGESPSDAIPAEYKQQ